MTSLTKLGPKILPILPDTSKLPAGDRKDRIEQLRAALKVAEEDIQPGASRVTLEGKGIRLTEAIQQLQKRTGNTHHRPARAARSRGDEPRAGSGDPR